MKGFLRLRGFGILTSLALVAVFATGNGCTSAVQDAQRTPVGGVLTGKTDSASSYLQDVERQNQQRQAQQPYSSGGPPRPSGY